MAARRHPPSLEDSLLRMAGRWIWEPDTATVERARVTAFMREQGIDDWHELHHRAETDIGWFWDAVVQHLGIEFFTPYDTVVDESRGPMWATWFGGGTINLAHNCVDRHAALRPDHPAVICEGEDGEVRTATYAELADLDPPRRGGADRSGRPPGRRRRSLPADGDRDGGGLLCRVPGSAQSPCRSSPGFGAPAVAARLADAGARCLITADAVPRRGRPVSMKTIADEAVASAPDVRHVVVVNRLGTAPPMATGRDLALGRAGRAAASPRLAAPPLDPETPMMVIYTSGTTGRPKGAVHVHGGFLVKIAEECAFQTDVGAGRPVHLDDRHGLDHGPQDRRRRRRAGRDAGALRGRAGLPRRRAACGSWSSATGSDRAGRLPHADPRAARRTATSTSPPTTARRFASSPRPASPGTPSRTAGCSRSAASRAARSSTSPAAPRSAPASSRRCR